MKILLLENVSKVGNKGEIRNVSAGYARNFLLNKNLARIVKEGEDKQIKAHQAELEKQANASKEELKKKADELKNLTIEIKKKASPGGALYASISNLEIKKKLHEFGFKGIKEEHIQPKEPIKKIGDHDIKIKLLDELEPGIKLKVIEEE